MPSSLLTGNDESGAAPHQNFLTQKSGKARFLVMPRTRPLKVYVTQIGFHEAIVAAHSQRAALEAWGISRNLFAVGRAHDTRDPAVCAMAMAEPGRVFARPMNSAKPFRAVRDIKEGAVTLAEDGPSGQSK
jgi:hypothetical protein